MEGRKLIRAYDVANMLGYRTETVKTWARSGKLPGAVFLGNPGRQHVRFDPAAIEEFIATGGQRPELPKQEEFTVRRHGCHEHAGGQPRNDHSRRDPSKDLADYVTPDPGVRPFDPMAEPPDLDRVPAGRYLSGGNA